MIVESGDLMKTQGACSDCKGIDSPVSWHAALGVIGVRVAQESEVGRGYERVDYTFMQCSVCGSVWVYYVETGSGGVGHFLRRLTKDLF